MSFAKIFSLWLIFFPLFLLADAIPFAVVGTPSALPHAPANLDDPQQQSQLIAELKYRAVSEWLQGYLGGRYPQFEKSVTPDFAERYVLDYKVARTGNNREAMQLTGHLDGDSLRRWVRLLETKKGNYSLKPVFLLSSSIPGLTFSANETLEKVKGSPLGEVVLGFANQQFHKLNVKTTIAERGVPTQNPPKNEAELRALREFGVQTGNNLALWTHISPCASCGGARVDVLVYGLTGPRLVLALNDDLALQPKDFGNTERLKAVFSPIFQEFHSEFESAISEGKLFATEYELIVEGLDSYRMYKLIETEFNKVEYLSQPVLRQAENRTARFSVLSSLSSEDLAQRIQGSRFANFQLKPVRVDSRSISVRYLK